MVAGEECIPAGAPDHLDHVPAGSAEDRFELGDDLAVAAHRAVQALQVAVDHPGQVVEALPGGQRDGAEGLGLVDLAIADEAPDPGLGGVVEPTVVEVLVEPGVIDRVDRPQTHRHRGELPEIGHETGVGIGGEAVAVDLEAEVVEMLLVEPSLEIGPGVDPGCGMPLHVDVVALAVGALAFEEVVEADLVEGRRRGEGGEVPPDPLGAMVGLDHHHGGVPPDEPPDPSLDVLVTGELGFLLGGDRVDVRRGDRRRRCRRCSRGRARAAWPPDTWRGRAPAR